MFELALGLVEGPVDRCVGVLKVALPRRRVRDEHLVSRKADVDRVTVLIPMTVMMPVELDHDVARDDAVEEVVELPGALPNMGCKGVRARHASERELKRCLHWGVRLRGAGFVRAGSTPRLCGDAEARGRHSRHRFAGLVTASEPNRSRSRENERRARDCAQRPSAARIARSAKSRGANAGAPNTKR
jgi:hypothetical protein